jgi:hypothetical protein
MIDPTQTWRFQQICAESAQYRNLKAIYDADPGLSPPTVRSLANCFRRYRDDSGMLRRMTNHRTDDENL